MARVPRVLGLVIVAALLVLLFSSLRLALAPPASPPAHLLHEGRHSPHYARVARQAEIPIVIVADMDHASKVRGKQAWQSHLKTGVISVLGNRSYAVRWTGEIPLYSSLNVGGRGMELSELLYFQGRLLAFSDRTGVIHQVLNNKIVPLWILGDGDGTQTEGFKSEWATVKDDLLYVGSTGKPWEDKAGHVLNRNRQWIKVIDSHGRIEHRDWGHVYQRIQNETNTRDGYVLHEAVSWEPRLRRWFFLPRKVSEIPFQRDVHQKIGAHIMISCDERWENWKIVEMGKYHSAHGYSAFRFLPGRGAHVAALKTYEVGDDVHTEITIIDVATGDVLLDEQHIAAVKYEGLEIYKEAAAAE